MNNTMEPFALIAQRAKEKAEARLLNQRIHELVNEIDALAEIMGSSDFRDAVRKQGYDIDACSATLGRRGVELN